MFERTIELIVEDLGVDHNPSLRIRQEFAYFIWIIDHRIQAIEHRAN